MCHFNCAIKKRKKDYRLAQLLVVKVPAGIFFAFIFAGVFFPVFSCSHPDMIAGIGILFGLAVHLLEPYGDRIANSILVLFRKVGR